METVGTALPGSLANGARLGGSWGRRQSWRLWVFVFGGERKAYSHVQERREPTSGLERQGADQRLRRGSTSGFRVVVGDQSGDRAAEEGQP